MKSAALGANYRKLWSAHAVSSLGDGMRETVIPLLAASLTRDPLTVSLVALAGGLPWLLLSLISGVLVDRLDRKRVMWRVDAFRAVVMACLAAIVVAGFAKVPTLIAVAFAIGAGETLFQNAALAILPSVVSKDRLEQANSRLYAAEIISEQFVGPPLGSLLFAAAVAVPFFLDAASFAIGGVLVLSMRGSFRAQVAEGAEAGTARGSMWEDIREGLRWLWSHKLLRALAVMLGVWNLLATATFAILVLYALEVLHVPEAAYGLLLALFAVGSLVGSFSARRLGAKLGTGTTLTCCLALSSASAFVMGLSSSAVLVGIVMIVDGVGGIIWNILTISLRQVLIPDHLLGRVSSVFRLIGLGSVPFGALLGGSLSRAFGLRAPFLVMGTGVAVMAAASLPIISNRRIEAARAEVRGDQS